MAKQTNAISTDDLMAFQSWANANKGTSLPVDGSMSKKVKSALEQYGIDYANYLHNNTASSLNSVIENDENKVKDASEPQWKNISIAFALGALATFIIMKYMVKTKKN